MSQPPLPLAASRQRRAGPTSTATAATAPLPGSTPAAATMARSIVPEGGSDAAVKHVTRPMMGVYLAATMYALTFQMQSPLLPFVVKGIGGYSGYERALSLFGVVQLVGGLVFGRIVDVYGGRKSLALTFACSAVSYVALASASSMTAVYLALLPGLFQHGVLAARAFIVVLCEREGWRALDGSASDSGTDAGDGGVGGGVGGTVVAPGDTCKLAVDASRVEHTGRATAKTHVVTLTGYVMLAYAIGFVIGPSVGAVLSADGDYGLAMGAAGVLAAFAAVASWAGLPDVSAATLAREGNSGSGGEGHDLHAGTVDSETGNAAAEMSTATKPSFDRGAPHESQAGSVARARSFDWWNAANVHSVLATARYPRVGSVLAMKTVLSMAGATFHAAFPLLAVDRYGLGSLEVGVIMSVLGVSAMLTHAVIVEWAVRRWTSGLILRTCMATLAMSNLGLAAASTPLQLVGVCLVMVVSASLISTVSTGLLNKLVPPDRVGAATAIDMGITSGARIFAPAIAVFLVTSVGHPSVGLVCAAFVALAAGMAEAKWLELDAPDEAVTRV